MISITDFNRMRCGSKFPASIDIEPIDGHECHGVLASAFTYAADGSENFVQVRRHNEHQLVALFAFGGPDMEIPEFWIDSTVLWDSRTATPGGEG